MYIRITRSEYYAPRIIVLYVRILITAILRGKTPMHTHHTLQKGCNAVINERRTQSYTTYMLDIWYSHLRVFILWRVYTFPCGVLAFHKTTITKPRNECLVHKNNTVRCTNSVIQLRFVAVSISGNTLSTLCWNAHVTRTPFSNVLQLQPCTQYNKLSVHVQQRAGWNVRWRNVPPACLRKIQTPGRKYPPHWLLGVTGK